jgi:hypothetical protein
MTSPTFYIYELPDGRLFRLAADLCHGAATTTFQLNGGRVVVAMLACDADQAATPLYDAHGVSTGFMARQTPYGPMPTPIEALRALVTEFDAYAEAMRAHGRGHSDHGKEREIAHMVLTDADAKGGR